MADDLHFCANRFFYFRLRDGFLFDMVYAGLWPLPPILNRGLNPDVKPGHVSRMIAFGNRHFLFSVLVLKGEYL